MRNDRVQVRLHLQPQRLARVQGSRPDVGRGSVSPLPKRHRCTGLLHHLDPHHHLSIHPSVEHRRRLPNGSAALWLPPPVGRHRQRRARLLHAGHRAAGHRGQGLTHARRHPVLARPHPRPQLRHRRAHVRCAHDDTRIRWPSRGHQGRSRHRHRGRRPARPAGRPSAQTRRRPLRGGHAFSAARLRPPDLDRRGRKQRPRSTMPPFLATWPSPLLPRWR